MRDIMYGVFNSPMKHASCTLYCNLLPDTFISLSISVISTLNWTRHKLSSWGVCREEHDAWLSKKKWAVVLACCLSGLIWSSIHYSFDSSVSNSNLSSTFRSVASINYSLILLRTVFLLVLFLIFVSKKVTDARNKRIKKIIHVWHSN